MFRKSSLLAFCLAFLVCAAAVAAEEKPAKASEVPMPQDTATAQEPPAPQVVQWGLMSFNIRWTVFDDKPGRDGRMQPWDGRKHMVAAVIKEADPDLIGLQEAMPVQRQYLLEEVPGYEDHRGILWKTEKFEMLEKGIVTLPDLGKPYDRHIFWVKLRSKELDQDVFLFNTHYPPGMGNRQALACQFTADFINQTATEEAHVIFTGDLNIRDRAGGGIPILRARARLHDPWTDTSASQRRVSNDGTSRTEGRSTIDWIFYRRPLKALKVERSTHNEDGVYPSDHLPVYALVTTGLTPRPKPPEHPSDDVQALAPPEDVTVEVQE